MSGDMGLSELRDMVQTVLAKKRELPTTDAIRDLIEKTRAICPRVSDEEAEQLVRELETVHGVSMEIGAILEDREFEPWLENRRSEMEFFYWDRYRRLLGDKKFSGQVLAAFDDVTDRILDHLENPQREGVWKRRGMVVGHVQSGKTANYTGLICKAADAGYKVIIVITGIHENLRSQTQVRIDEGFIGFDSTRLLTSSPRRIVGVGRYGSSRRPTTFTNALQEFTRNTATSIGLSLDNLTEPAIFVIKKHSPILRNLIDWLKEHNAKTDRSSIGSPTLLIDDEADNASINIRWRNDEVSKINGQIRELLRLFSRNCYVGYTATPFANIFIDPDSDDEMFGEDLFPKDFIVDLDPPDNYFGPDRVFLNDASKVIRPIEDNEDIIPMKHPISLEVRETTESLRTAIRTFILAIAIRVVRGHRGEHNSMLVNVSRFVRVQKQLRDEIHGFVEVIRQSLRINGAKPEEKAVLDPEIGALRSVFSREFAADCGVSWQNIQPHLFDGAARIKVVEVNSSSLGSLNYSEYRDSGLNVIAVGGYSLSRGMTLEGLHVSYFLRKSIMYDTLMQMGRWFGYRQGYDDLCRIWMPEEAEGWYAHITESIEELRYDLRRMERAGATPEEFGLKVRSHPSSLIVTARNKMGSSVKQTVAIGLANRFIETATLLWDHDSIETNRRAAIRLAADVFHGIQKAPGDGEPVNCGLLVREVPSSIVIDFLNRFKNHQESMATETTHVKDYIEKHEKTVLKTWDILFAGVKERFSRSLIDDSLGFKLVCQRRAQGKSSVRNKTLLITNKQRVASRGMEKVGLENGQAAEVEKQHRQDNKSSVNYPDHIYRGVRSKPLLIIHMLAIGEGGEDLSNSKPVVAWSMSFPKSEGQEKKVEYLVNTSWFRENYGHELEEEATDDDDE